MYKETVFMEYGSSLVTKHHYHLIHNVMIVFLFFLQKIILIYYIELTYGVNLIITLVRNNIC